MKQGIYKWEAKYWQKLTIFNVIHLSLTVYKFKYEKGTGTLYEAAVQEYHHMEGTTTAYLFVCERAVVSPWSGVNSHLLSDELQTVSLTTRDTRPFFPAKSEAR